RYSSAIRSPTTATRAAPNRATAASSRLAGNISGAPDRGRRRAVGALKGSVMPPWGIGNANPRLAACSRGLSACELPVQRLELVRLGSARVRLGGGPAMLGERGPIA